MNNPMRAEAERILAEHDRFDGNRDMDGLCRCDRCVALRAVTGTEAEVCRDIAARQALGIKKYGQSVADNPLPHDQWLQHAYEECLDMAVYLKRSRTALRQSPRPGEHAAPKMIYLAAPYTFNGTSEHDVVLARVQAIDEFAASVFQMGHYVFSPISHTHPIKVASDGKLPGGFAFWANYDYRMIDFCDELWVLKLDGWEKSVGVRAEIEYAERNRKPVVYRAPSPRPASACRMM
jgi:hypothetical protein